MADTQVAAILITQAHGDPVGSLAEVKAGTNAPVYIIQLDAAGFILDFDLTLLDGQIMPIGDQQVCASHIPGMTCLDLGDGRIVMGDTVFVDGPGKTRSKKGFRHHLAHFFYPGHGPSGTI